MIKVTIDNEEVVSNQTFEIKEDMLSASSTILNNCFPKLWEEDHDYISRFYFPKDYSQCNISDVTTVTPIEGLTATGKSLNINYDNSLEYELELLKGDTYQETYSGKNLLNVSDLTPITNVTNVNGVITINGSFSSTSWSLTNPFTLKANTTYTLSLTNTYENAGSSTFILRNGSTNIMQVRFTDGVATYTPTQDTIINVIRMYNNGKTYDNYSFSVQLEIGSTATEYEKYVGGMPSPNPDYPQAIETVTGRQDIYVCGKNLFDINSITTGKILNTGTGLEQNSDSNRAITDFMQIDNTQPYILSGILGTASLSEIYVFYYDTNNEYIGATINRGTGDLGELEYNIRSYTGYSRAKSIRLRIDDLSHLSNLQLEKGNQATSYEPYQGTTYEINLGNIELCKINNARDYIYKFENNWYLHKEIGKVLLDGSEDGWTRNSSISGGYERYYLPLENSNPSSSRNICLSNYFMFVSGHNVGTCFIHSSRVYLYPSLNINTLVLFKNWLSTHNTEVYYQLATPTNTQITDSELIAQLNAFDLYNGINNIEISSPNLSGDVQIYYNFRTGSVTTKEIFTGVVKNTGNISLNPRDPKYCSLQILSYDTFLSEGKILDYVISNKTVTEAINELISKISDYGVEVGFINIPINQDVTIEAYSTLNQSPYDVFQYLSEISATHWTTEYSNGKVKIYYYANEQEGGPGLSYEYNYDDLLKDENVLDISWNLNTRDYRNRQIIKSNKVYSSITTIDNIYANGYETTFTLTQPVGKIETILVNGIAKTFATKKQQELGIYADFYYEVDKNTIESSDLYVNGSEIVVTYYAIIEGRQAINNASEVDRITTSTGINGTIERYETRNDVNSSSELVDIANTYLQYKGSPEITLTIKTINDDLKIQVGNYVTYLMPSFPQLQGKYLCKAKKTSITKTGESGIAFYEMTLTSSENVESAINYFDNQRRKVESNISAGDFITRNIDINNTALIKFQNTQVTEISTTGDNVLNCGLNAPLVK